jgi:hypothetical protein
MLPVVDLADAEDVAAVVAGAVGFDMVPLGGTLDDGGGVAAGAEEDPVLPDELAFCTPPWPLQAPRPVALDVVPSLQAVGAAAAWAPAVCTAKPDTSRTREGTIIRTRGKVLIGFAPRVDYDWGCPATG